MQLPSCFVFAAKDAVGGAPDAVGGSNWWFGDSNPLFLAEGLWGTPPPPNHRFGSKPPFSRTVSMAQGPENLTRWPRLFVGLPAPRRDAVDGSPIALLKALEGRPGGLRRPQNHTSWINVQSKRPNKKTQHQIG